MISNNGKTSEAQTTKPSSAAKGYAPDLAKDIAFLKEMQRTFNKVNNGNGWDRMSMDHLGVMISDWLHELEEIDAA
jgi:hypothetical protein